MSTASVREPIGQQKTYIWLMEVKIQIPFQQLLAMVRALTPSQKTKLRKELDEQSSIAKEKDDFIDFLLQGPVYNEEETNTIKENRKSIAAWRTKS